MVDLDHEKGGDQNDRRLVKINESEFST